MDMQQAADLVKTAIEKKSEGRQRSLANLIPAKKGEVRNPRGRPKKDYDLANEAQKHATKAIATLVACMESDEATWNSKVSAAAEILDRGFGRAPQSLDVEHKVGFTEQFEDFLRALSGQRRHDLIEAEVLEAAE